MGCKIQQRDCIQQLLQENKKDVQQDTSALLYLTAFPAKRSENVPSLSECLKGSVLQDFTRNLKKKNNSGESIQACLSSLTSRCR